MLINYKEYEYNMNIVNIQKIMNRLWRWGYESVKIMNMVLIVNGMLRRCGWMIKNVNKMWTNDKELRENGNSLVIY